jgi:hypothetical protein
MIFKKANSFLGALIVLAALGTSFMAKKSTNTLVSQTQTPKVVAKKEITKQIEVPHKVHSKSVLEVADSICQVAGVPFELVKEIGQNESGWQYIGNTTGGTDFGDLQVIDITFDYWYNRLKLQGGKTRRNYLKIGIYYLKWLYDREGSWQKARFCYGRGTWRDESTWTTMEKQFMHKIDWSKYD